MESNIANIADNIGYLQQAIDLLKHMDTATFTHNNPPYYTGGVGPHLRHCLDHYVSLMDGFPSGKIDYDCRERDVQLETDPAYAIRFIERIIEGLKTYTEADLDIPLKIKMDCGTVEDCPWSDGSLKRELQFMISHTVHHYAIIGMILKDQGITPSEEFGVAPSTLKYREQSAKCAPSAG